MNSHIIALCKLKQEGIQCFPFVLPLFDPPVVSVFIWNFRKSPNMEFWLFSRPPLCPGGWGASESDSKTLSGVSHHHWGSSSFRFSLKDFPLVQFRISLLARTNDNFFPLMILLRFSGECETNPLQGIQILAASLKNIVSRKPFWNQFCFLGSERYPFVTAPGVSLHMRRERPLPFLWSPFFRYFFLTLSH